MKQNLKTILLMTAVVLAMESSDAVEFEPLGKSVAAALGTKKAFKKSVSLGKETTDVFYSVGSNGKAEKFAIIQKGIYEPNCTHTWVVGIDAATSKVLGIRVVEMSCPHAFPTKTASFLDQYVGKGPADFAKLTSDISSVAKATGSCNLTTDAVKKSITIATKLKGKL